MLAAKFAWRKSSRKFVLANVNLRIVRDKPTECASRGAAFSAIGLLLLVQSVGAATGNLLINGDFATDFSGWTIADSSAGQNIAFWTSPAGTPPSPGGTGGCLNLTAFRNSSITASQCVAITGNTIDASVLIFPFVTTGPSFAQLVAFGSGECGGGALGTIPLAPKPSDIPGWIIYDVQGAPVPPGTSSVRFELGTSDGDNGSDGDYLFDGARLEAANIFEDGFEGTQD